MPACNRHNADDLRRESLLALSRAHSRTAVQQSDSADYIADPALALAFEQCATVLFSIAHALESAAHGEPQQLTELAALATSWLGEQRFVAAGFDGFSEVVFTDSDS